MGNTSKNDVQTLKTRKKEDFKNHESGYSYLFFFAKIGKQLKGLTLKGDDDDDFNDNNYYIFLSTTSEVIHDFPSSPFL